MNILSADTSTDVLSIALSTDNSYEERLVKGRFSHSEDLLAEIESLLSRAGIGMADLDLLAVTKGPGSFTGLRIGMASMKGISSALSVPLASIPTLDAIAEAASTYPGAILPAIDARKHRFYISLHKGGRTIVPDRDGNAEDIMERLDKGLLDFGLIIQPADISKYGSVILPNKDTWGIIMNRESELASKKAIKREDLRGKPLIISKQISRRESARGGLLKWLGPDIGRYNIVARYNLLYNASVMAEKGIGYVVGLDKIVDTSLNSALCFRPLIPKLESEMGIIWKKGRLFSTPAKLFLNKIREYCGE